ncbi:MAG: hypothetical protein HQM06_16625 [Magnetococcales bacterium]|nr:hypothetical protein [Magnetococcales bacterium]
MPNTFESARAAHQINAKPQPTTRQTIIIFSIILTILILALAGIVWQTHRSQPITDEQRQQLTLLADSTAERSGKTRQKVWSELKITLNIRRIQDIQKKDFDRATEWLLQEAK